MKTDYFRAILFAKMIILLIITQFVFSDLAISADRSNFDHFNTGFPLTGFHQSLRCESCHVRGVFKGTPKRCNNCHASTGVASGSQKPTNHIPTNLQCEDCHSTNTWNVNRLDHSRIMGLCTNCHNGSFAAGKTPTHVQTTAQCDACHSTVAWLPARFDHATITGSCSNCHNGTTATGKPVAHFITTLQCDTCHIKANWTTNTFRHVSPAYPGDHRKRLVCRDCHLSNSQIVSWPNAAYQPDCAGCHAGDYKRGPHKKVDSPKIEYTISELRDCTGSCHQYKDSSFTEIEKSRTGEHKISDGEF